AVDSGGVVALRPEARAGGADGRRRRCRWRVGGRRPLRGTPACSARGDPAEHPGGGSPARRAQRAFRVARSMTRVRLGAVGYLNARPHVFGLDRAPRFTLRFDVPSKCAELLHGGEVDAGLIPSIEYLRGSYAVVPDIAIASRGPVSSVMLYTTRPMAEVRSIALDTSSRTSVALARVLCARVFHIQPRFEPQGPDLE